MEVLFKDVIDYFKENPRVFELSSMIPDVGILASRDPREWILDADQGCLDFLFSEYVKINDTGDGVIVEKPEFISVWCGRSDDLTAWVCRSYDEECHPWEENAWDHFGLSGDDAVDYNGGYLDMFVGLIATYVVHNRK